MISITPKLNFTFIFLLIITLIGGSYMVLGHIGGVEISAYRFVLMVTTGYLILTKQLVFYTNRFSRFVFYFFVVWFLYGAISLIWAPDLIYGIKELFYLGIGAFTFFIFLSFSHFEKDFEKMIENVLIFSFIVVVGLFVFEMITQQHLDGEYTDKLLLLGDFHKSNIIPVFTFVNPNVGAIYLCLCIVFSACFFFRNRNRMLHITIILISFDFLLLMESRLGILSVLAMFLLTFILLILKKNRSRFSWTFSKTQLLAMTLLIMLNSVVLYSEFNFLKSESNILGQDNTTCELCYEVTDKIYKRIAEYGRILIISDLSLTGKQDSSCLMFDKVFVIENDAYIKLLNNELVELQFKEVNKDLYGKLFVSGDNLLLVVSVTLLFFVLVTAFILSYRFAKDRRMVWLPLTGIFIVILLSWNVYQFPTEGYKRRVLVEKESDVDRLKKSDLNIVSTDFHTGKLLQRGKSVKTYLFSEKNQGIINSLTDHGAKMGSNSIRKNLALNGLDYLQKSHYMGVGSGGFLASNMKKLNKYPDGGVGGAHSFIIEILSQYGVVIFALLVGIFLYIVSILFQAFSKGVCDEKHFLVLWLLIILIFMGNANSTFLSLPMNWLVVTFLLIFANKLIVEKEKPNEIKI